MKSLRIGFMGTPDFALPALKALVDSEHAVACVYSQPPRPKGRGKKLQYSPVHRFAQSHGIPVFTPVSLKSPEAQEEFAQHNLDVAIVAAYGLILPEVVLDTPHYGCLNIHASLLPRWRGASPIQQAIWHGDHETGITIMQMDKGLDTGPIISAQAVPLTNTTTTPELHDKLAQIGADLIVETLNTLSREGHLNATSQDGSHVTLAPLLKKTDARIDWSQNATEIDRQIRALNPWPGVYALHNEKRFKIKAAHILDESASEPGGTVLDREGRIACGNHTVLQITQIQPANSKAMDFAAAVNGGHIKVGARLT